LILAEPIKKFKLHHDMTNMEEEKERRVVASGIKASSSIVKAVRETSLHCPKLLEMLLSGYEGRDWD
jgi:hypothetical protein